MRLRGGTIVGLWGATVVGLWGGAVVGLWGATVVGLGGGTVVGLGGGTVVGLRGATIGGVSIMEGRSTMKLWGPRSTGGVVTYLLMGITATTRIAGTWANKGEIIAGTVSPMLR
jgi:hypothetical protein